MFLTFTRPQVVERPWAFAGRIIIPARKPGEKYSEPVRIPDIVQEPVPKAGSNTVYLNGVDGKFLAQDMLNPDDPAGNLISAGKLPVNQQNSGTNLYKEGCFWTLNEVPTDEELKAATVLMEAYYNEIIRKADSNDMLNTRDSRLEIGVKEFHAAAYFGIEKPWNKVLTAPVFCPGCGEQINPKAKFHKCYEGFITQIDEAWCKEHNVGQPAK